MQHHVAIVINFFPPDNPQPMGGGWGDPVISFSDPNAAQNPRNRDCKSGDRYFYNGAEWHPVIGPFGEMNCVTCHCKNGKPTVQKLSPPFVR